MSYLVSEGAPCIVQDHLPHGVCVWVLGVIAVAVGGEHPVQVRHQGGGKLADWN